MSRADRAQDGEPGAADRRNAGRMHAALPDVDCVEIEGGSQGMLATHAADVNRGLLALLGQSATVGQLRASATSWLDCRLADLSIALLGFVQRVLLRLGCHDVIGVWAAP